MAGYGYYGGYAPYVPVAERRRKAEKEAASLAKKGKILAPVQPGGRLIATTFWGKAWCDHLEIHCDHANRLPRGKTYVRNGSVIDLQIRAGQVTALVSGSSIYTVKVQVQALPATRWHAVAAACAGRVESLVELLQGRLDKGVLQRLCHATDGLLPLSREFSFDCSCPDGAAMCKHVAATLYGVGHRLDSAPELLFLLRQVDQGELVRHATTQPMGLPATAARTLDEASLGDVFGLDLDDAGPLPAIAALKLPGIPAPVGAKAVAAQPKHAAAPLPSAKPAPAETPTRYILATFMEFPDNEMTCADLFAAQAEPRKFTRDTLKSSLTGLLTSGKVRKFKDPEDGRVYWSLASGSAL